MDTWSLLIKCPFAVKLPEFLSATNIADEKLRLILKHLDDFME